MSQRQNLNQLQAETPGKTSPEPSSRPDEGLYVYCIIESEEPRDFGDNGIGGRNDTVFTVHHKGLAAIVSKTPVVVYDPTRENVLTHEAVNETVMKEFSVIPMSFGTVFRTDEDVVEFLRHTESTLYDVIHKLRDKIEFGIKVNWDSQPVMQEIEQERDDIRLLRDQIASTKQGSTYFARMQLGRLVEQAMTEKAEAYIEQIYEELRGVAIASRQNKPIGETMILNAAFLVERMQSSEFEQRLQDLAQRHDQTLKFLFTGPWPPYNFVNIRLKLETPGRNS